MNESTDMASNIQQATIIMRSKVESLVPHLVFLLALAFVFSFSMTAYSGYAHAANCAQKMKQCEKQISKLRDQQLKLGKKALKLVRQRSKIRHEYAPVQSALSEIKTMQGLLRDSKAELDAAAKASGNRVSYQSNGRAMGIISGSGSSGGSANVQMDIYNTQFDKYQPTLKHEKKLKRKAKAFQKKLKKLNKAIAKIDKRSAAIKQKIIAQQKKCRKLAEDCQGKKKQSAKTNKFGGYPGSSVNGGNNDAGSGYGNYGNGDNVAGNGNGNGYGGYDNGGNSDNGIPSQDDKLVAKKIDKAMHDLMDSLEEGKTGGKEKQGVKHYYARAFDKEGNEVERVDVARCSACKADLAKVKDILARRDVIFDQFNSTPFKNSAKREQLDKAADKLSDLFVKQEKKLFDCYKKHCAKKAMHGQTKGKIDVIPKGLKAPKDMGKDMSDVPELPDEDQPKSKDINGSGGLCRSEASPSAYKTCASAYRKVAGALEPCKNARVKKYLKQLRKAARAYTESLRAIQHEWGSLDDLVKRKHELAKGLKSRGLSRSEKRDIRNEQKDMVKLEKRVGKAAKKLRKLLKQSKKIRKLCSGQEGSMSLPLPGGKKVIVGQPGVTPREGAGAAPSGGNSVMGVAKDVGGVISHAFAAIGACKKCADLFKQYMKLSDRIARLEKDWGPYLDGPFGPDEYKQRRKVKKALNKCLKKCEARKKAGGKAGAKKGGEKDNGIKLSTGYVENEFDQSSDKTDFPGNSRKVARGAQLTPNGFRDRGDSEVIEDDAFKTDSTSVVQGSGTCASPANRMATPIVLNNPESKSIAKKTTSALSGFAMGALGVGGVSPYAGSGGDKGAPMVPTPRGDWLTFADEGSGVKIQVMAWVHKSRNKNRPSEIRIAQRIKDSPDKGAPHMMMLQHRDGHFIKPTGYMIFEQWMRWTLTITTIRESYVDGQRVSHSETRESTSWNELQGRYKKLIEAPGIWEQFGLPPFGKLKGIIALFPLPDHFNPADWSLVKHETAKSTIFGAEVIKTVPFVLDLSQGKKNDLNVVQSPGGKTRYQQANGCPSADEIMKAALRIFVPVGLSGGAQKKTSAYKMKRIKQDAAHWARILILQPGPTGQWLKDYHRLSQPVQVDAAVAMATDIMLRIVTGRGLGLRDTQAWEKNFSRLNKHVRNLAIEAANRWKHGISEQQRSRISRNYSKLTPRLQQLFQREFVFTLASNLFFDLRQPDPVVLKPVNGARGGASIR